LSLSLLFMVFLKWLLSVESYRGHIDMLCYRAVTAEFQKCLHMIIRAFLFPSCSTTVCHNWSSVTVWFQLCQSANVSYSCIFPHALWILCLEPVFLTVALLHYAFLHCHLIIIISLVNSFCYVLLHEVLGSVSYFTCLHTLFLFASIRYRRLWFLFNLWNHNQVWLFILQKHLISYANNTLLFVVRVFVV
jgi:hypothetical protein